MSTPPSLVITSKDNRVFKELKRLLTGGRIKREGRALVSGSRLVAETLEIHPDRCEGWITAETQSMSSLPATAEHLTHYRLSPELFGSLDVFGTRSPILLFRPPEPEAWDPADGLPAGLSVLVPFQDPPNVGAVIRSAVAFGADRVILLAESAHPFHPKTLRASGGAVLSARLLRGPSVKALPAELPLVPLSREGRDIRDVVFPDPCGLLLGPEGEGLPEEWRERAVSIPIRPELESLNAAVAAAIALYVWSRAAQS